PGIRVISRTSAMQYKNTHKTLPQIARELNVDAVVEGTVLRVGILCPWEEWMTPSPKFAKPKN
ncbi:MAG: hypothetical protein WBL63_21950, partial [Candidatus Acidiferrum sp.]